MCQASGRLFQCGRCQKQVIICSKCDRGHRYCFDGCAEQARREKTEAANQRYRHSLKGQLKAAERQARHRQRLREKEIVTHQGIGQIAANDSMISPSRTEPQPEKPVNLNRCHRCGAALSPYLRLDWLRYGTG